jgi:formate dehydrogenase subunit gamma
MPWNTRLAEDVIAAEMAAARAFYGEDGAGATAMLPILHALQHAFGYLPAAAIPLIAERLNVSKADVRGVISFYHDFDEAPPAPRVLKLCRAEACQALGVERVAAHLAAAHDLARRPAAYAEKSIACKLRAGPAALIDGVLVVGFDEAAADAAASHGCAVVAKS